jgi:hypothetical protein
MHGFNRYAVLVLLVCGQAHALDGFEKVRCGADIRAALVGQRMSDEADSVVEGRHAALGLKDLGGYEVSDRLFASSWRICGAEFELLLDKRSTVRDAVPFPAHSRSSPGFNGACQVDGKPLPGTIVAVLRDETGADLLAAEAAWKIDETAAKFVSMPTAGLRCPRTGIFSSDGGR